MSGEFGSYSSGYFDTQISYAIEDLAGGRDALSREWSKFFHAFLPIAHAICRSEACDSGPSYPIMETIGQMPRLKQVLDDIDKHVRVYKEVADAAVREAEKARNR